MVMYVISMHNIYAYDFFLLFFLSFLTSTFPIKKGFKISVENTEERKLCFSIFREIEETFCLLLFMKCVVDRCVERAVPGRF